jgi:hypothetical protein
MPMLYAHTLQLDVKDRASIVAASSETKDG